MTLPRILIVEDEKPLAIKYGRVLESLGTCTIVESSPDVFYYLNFDPQVIMLDIRLLGDPVYGPERAGIRILEKIRELPAPDRDIPVIIMTGSSEPEVEEQCRQLGVEEFFHKSQVSNEDLRGAVRAALEHGKQSMEENAPDNDPTVILFLAANPLDTSRLEVGREFREIEATLQKVKLHKRFDVRMFDAVRPSDLQGYLRRYTPAIVHFSGHGDFSGSIILEGKSGEGKPVPTDALSDFFNLNKGKIRCVVLNACYTDQQARAIAEHVDCVIGMTSAISDEAAISFATAFYEALGDGDNIKNAYDLGCNRIHLEDLGEQDRPHLIAHNGDPEKITFA